MALTGDWEYVGNVPDRWIKGGAPPAGYTTGPSWGEIRNGIEYEVEGYTRVGESKPSFWRRRISAAQIAKSAAETEARRNRQTDDPSWDAAKKEAARRALAELQKSQGIVNPETGVRAGETPSQFDPNALPPIVNASPYDSYIDPSLATGGVSRANIPPARVYQEPGNIETGLDINQQHAIAAQQRAAEQNRSSAGGVSGTGSNEGRNIWDVGFGVPSHTPTTVVDTESAAAAIVRKIMQPNTGGVSGTDWPDRGRIIEEGKTEAESEGFPPTGNGKSGLTIRDQYPEEAGAPGPKDDLWVTKWSDGTFTTRLLEEMTPEEIKTETGAWLDKNKERVEREGAERWLAAQQQQPGQGGPPPGQGGPPPGQGGPPPPTHHEASASAEGTGPRPTAKLGDTFGDPKYTINGNRLTLSEWGSTPGGGNPDEMYLWFIEATIAGYENVAELWMNNPEQAIGAYNQWKIREQAAGRHFIGVDEQGNPGGSRIVPFDPDDPQAYQKELAELERAKTERQAVASATTGVPGAVPGAVPGVPGAQSSYGIPRGDIASGFDPASRAVAQEEALRGAGLYAGNPFLESIQQELGRAFHPYKFAQTAYQTLNPGGPDVPQYDDFLQGRLAGETGMGGFGTPDVMGNITNPSSARWELLAGDIEADPRWAFDIAAQTLGFGGRTFMRDALYDQQSRLRNQYLSQQSQGQIPDTLGADYYNFLQQQLGTP